MTSLFSVHLMALLLLTAGRLAVTHEFWSILTDKADNKQINIYNMLGEQTSRTSVLGIIVE